jgi:hypothetical protein
VTLALQVREILHTKRFATDHSATDIQRTALTAQPGDESALRAFCRIKWFFFESDCRMNT